MNFETIKSFILIILVGLSLLLTFVLWNYQPSLEYSSNNGLQYVNEVDIGGTEETKKSIIGPTTIVFHKEDKFFGFNNPNQRQKLFEEIQDWVLDDYVLSSAHGRPKKNHQVEVVFPTPLPAEMINNLFTLNQEDSMPSWSFKRMFISFDERYSVLKLTFFSIDGLQKIEYTVKDSIIYDRLWSYFSVDSELSEFVLFDTIGELIFLPAEPPEIKNRSITVQTIDSFLLVNALFSNPSIVSPNIGEAFFSDGQRGMRVLNEGRRMEFINPIHSNGQHMDPIVLLDRSIDKINEHKGWTDEFTLENINVAKNELSFRMLYEGYPVFANVINGDLAIIEQQWLNQDLHIYRRPLFWLDNLLGGETLTLASGKDIINFFKNVDYYDITKITDIQVGYRLKYLEGMSYSLTLTPTWYMKYKGNWMEIMSENVEDLAKGVN